MNADTTLLEQSLDVLDDVFYHYDDEGRLRYWNQRLNDLFGLSDDELDGMAPADFFVEADRTAVRAAVEEVFETGETVVEARAETTDGTILFELTGQAMQSDDGSISGFCGVGRDVTRVREREWQLERQNERLEQFAGILAHDLRNPLQVAMARIEAATQEGESEHLQPAAEALDRVGDIIEDVLTVAKEGRIVTEKEPVDIATVAARAWDAVETGDATLTVETTMSVPADGDRVQRLFENVFRNSVEHGSTSNRTASGDSVEHGGSGVAVTVTATERGFAVEDDGVGVPAEVRDAVFDHSFGRESAGSGLGLNIVQNLAEAHGWAVEMAAGAEGGARLEFDVGGVESGDETVSLRPGTVTRDGGE